MADRDPGLPEERRISFRIGVNLGDVIAEEHDIFGDGVNVAARLEALAEPGGICISRVVRDQVRDKVEFGFDDLGEQHVKNIARPVRVYRVRRSGAPEQVTSAIQPSLAWPDKPSVAVLSFSNMSADPEQEFFADGIAEDVITALSRCSSLFVIARNSSFTYKGRAINVKEIGRELGVRYVLEGSLRKSGSRVRVTAQLVEAETGRHVWAERYDRDLADIFAMQDEIAEAVTIAVAPAVADAELHRALRKPPENLDAWAAYQRGLWHVRKFTVEDNAIAQRFFQQAIELDPTFARGHTGLAWAEIQAANVFQTRSLLDAQGSIEALARGAVALDNSDSEARSWLGFTLLLAGDHKGALVEAERALAISPNLAIAHAVRGAILIYSGRPKDGVAALQQYLRLDPRDPFVAIFLLQVAIGHYFSGDYETAVEVVKQVFRSYPGNPLSYRWLPAALGQLGRIDEAKEALQEALTVAPGIFDLYVSRRAPWFRQEDHAHLVEGLRKAGWRGQ
jgi:adenylate cyclase